jgi:hypothetical protein
VIAHAGRLALLLIVTLSGQACTHDRYSVVIVNESDEGHWLVLDYAGAASVPQGGYFVPAGIVGGFHRDGRPQGRIHVFRASDCARAGSADLPGIITMLVTIPSDGPVRFEPNRPFEGDADRGLYQESQGCFDTP